MNKLVPLEPTEEMLDAAIYIPSIGAISSRSARDIYKAMLSAAPPASILDDLEGLPVVKSEQQFKAGNGTYLVDAVLLSDLNAIIEKHKGVE